MKVDQIVWRSLKFEDWISDMIIWSDRYFDGRDFAEISITHITTFWSHATSAAAAAAAEKDAIDNRWAILI